MYRYSCGVNVHTQMDMEWFTDQNKTKKNIHTLISQWYINILSIKHKILQSQVFVFRCYCYFVMCVYFPLLFSLFLSTFMPLTRSSYLSSAPFISLSPLSYPHNIGSVLWNARNVRGIYTHKSRDNSNKFWLYFMLFSSFTEIFVTIHNINWHQIKILRTTEIFPLCSLYCVSHSCSRNNFVLSIIDICDGI